MSKLILSFILAAILFTIIGGWMEGSGGVQASALSSPMTITDNQLEIADTTNWLSYDIISVDNEDMIYTSKDATHLKGLTRGAYSSKTVTHKTGAYVYTQGASAINRALGFNIAAISASNGWYTVIIAPYKFFSVTLPYLMFFNFVMFEGDMALFRYLLMAAGVSLYVVLAISIGQVLAYALRR